jgi:hypothetical protein
MVDCISAFDRSERDAVLPTIFCALPEHLNFPFSVVGPVHTKRVRILNNGRKLARIMVPPSTTDSFSFTMDTKLGNLAPGMEQIVNVHFTPKSTDIHRGSLKVLYEVNFSAAPSPFS